MVYQVYRVASRIAQLNKLLNAAERKVLLNTFHKARSNSTASASWPPPKLLRKYSLFQMKNNLPVYIKAGFSDKFVFNSTVALIAVGLIDGMYTLLSMAYPKKQS
ncbi:hypothetical protein QE152_g1975 [Popillia japonica]|uniref:Uncharacterized protein n=1 Tax=Popillia japonica TaxID=7064 RepID=A0AAW1N744_POPJA